MDRSTIMVVLITLVGSAVLSGCTAAAHPQGSAKDVQPPADQAASEWAADAELVTIVGLEGAWTGGASGHASTRSWHGENHGGTSYSFTASARSDQHVGDGACQMWVLRYISPSLDRALDVVVDGNGTVVAQDEGAIDDDDVPLGEYAVNSDAAVAAALGASPSLDAAVKNGSGLLLVLDRDGETEHPVWIVMAGSGGGGFAIIDAVTGEVVFAMDEDWQGGYSGYQTGGYPAAGGGHGAGA